MSEGKLADKLGLKMHLDKSGFQFQVSWRNWVCSPSVRVIGIVNLVSLCGYQS